MPIRLARETDVPALLEIYAPYVLNTTVSFEYTVPSEADFLLRFRQITAQFPWLVWEEAGRILGYAYGSLPFERAAYHWCSEASVYLRADARRKGIGRALYTVLEEILRQQGYKIVYALITGENEASLTFHRALGYTHTARFPGCGFKFGRWMDVVWMEKLLNVVESPSNFPVRADTIVKNDRNLAKILAILSLS